MRRIRGKFPGACYSKGSVPRLVAISSSLALALVVVAGGCREPASSVEPERGHSAPAPRVLDDDEEALLATLLSEDPGDFHGARARIWRFGPARWIPEGPVLPGQVELEARTALERPLEVVVVDPEGPRVLLPLDRLDPAGARDPSASELVERAEDERAGEALASAWSHLRLVAALRPGDLVLGLRRELQPTPWLTVTAGAALTPLDSEDDHLRVRWSDPACGFALQLAVEREDFGPLYEPGPSGSPSDPPAEDARDLRLAPGAAVFAEAKGGEPVLRLDAHDPQQGERMSVAQQVELLGELRHGRRPIRLRCRGVVVQGWVDPKALVASPGRFAFVARPSPAAISSCAGADGDAAETVSLRAGTPLFEPRVDRPALVGAVAEELELSASLGPEGWWRACVPSPWGDLRFQFRPR